MFKILRRISGSFFLRPDRPWMDDATSHAPTIGRKRRYSVTERDGDGPASSSPKRTKNDPVMSDAERDATPGEENPKGDVAFPVGGQDMKEATKGVKEVDLEDKDEAEHASSIRPEGVPLPDSPSGSPDPQPELQEPEPAPESDEVEAPEAQEHEDDRDSVASSVPGYDAKEAAEEEHVTTNTDTPADEIVPAQEVNIAVEPALLDTPDILEVKA